MCMRIIINADDFGYSSDVNGAITEALKKGLISSTTMLVNMPGFEEAAKLTKTKDFINRVGIHLNLFEGLPLTKEMQECQIFCDKNGLYHGNRMHFLAPLKTNSSVIYNELHAQIEKAVNAGIKPTHLDSHAHRHTNYFIGNIVVRLAKEFRIPSVRIHPNLTKGNKLLHMKVSLFNLGLKWHGIKSTDYLGNIPEVISAIHEIDGIIEMIVHPIYKNTELSDLEYPGNFTQLMAPTVNIEKISYCQL